ncbi:MAG: DUF624 domain-containing protein [Clostridia bacterium]|nr:DUF624 domain-containing protein [Clostridia bacterium]
MGIFNSYTKPGKGVSKEDVQKSGIPLYFDIFLRRFWKFISINLLYIAASIPAIIISFFIANYFIGIILSVTGLAEYEEFLRIIPLLAILFSVVILQATGSGPASVGHTEVVRKYVKDTHAWIWSDFIGSFKQNFKQGIAVYVINVVVFFMIAFGYLFYRYFMSGTISAVLSTLILVLGVIFCIMQKYVYVLVSGFQLKIKHVYKNAFILAIVGLKWNIFSAVIIGAMLYGMAYLYISMTGVAFAVILCFYFTLVNFTQTFITNNVVKKYLEEPALEKENIEEE